VVNGYSWAKFSPRHLKNFALAFGEVEGGKGEKHKRQKHGKIKREFLKYE